MGYNAYGGTFSNRDLLRYFNFKAQGYRVIFNSTGHLVTLRNPSSGASEFIPLIPADGHFQTIASRYMQMRCVLCLDASLSTYIIL